MANLALEERSLGCPFFNRNFITQKNVVPGASFRGQRKRAGVIALVRFSQASYARAIQL